MEPLNPAPKPPGFSRTAIMRRRAVTQSTNWGLLVLATLAVMFLGALALAIIALEAGVGSMLLGTVCATLPVPVYVALLLWLDRYEPEPTWMLATAFCWGGLVAFLSSVIVNTINMILISVVLNSEELGQSGGAILSAPIVEEFTKALILYIFFIWGKSNFDGIVDGVVYAGMVALGFAMTENILYYANSSNQGLLGATLFVRGILSPYAHPLFTSMTGIGLGWARESGHSIVKYLAPLCGLLLAMFLHFVWNFSAVIAGTLGFLVTYAIIMVPAFFVVLLVVILALKREGRMVNEKLKPELACGVLSATDLHHLSSVRRRMGASMTAFTSGGFSAWRARSAFHSAASDLAFHRKRLERGQILHGIDSVAHEENLVSQIKALKEKLSR